MQDIREIELRDSGSNANIEIYFEVRATALRLCLHTERFPLRPHRKPPLRNLQLQSSEYTTPLSNTTTSTQKVRHKVKTTITSTQEARHKAKTTTTSTQEG